MIPIKEIARVCHEANRAYCEALEDNSQLSWEIAPKWQLESAVNGVTHAIENPEAPPSASHESWLEEKRKTGWKYGKVKDAEKKEHPCFVAYNELPEEQKKKDKLFLAVIKALV